MCLHARVKAGTRVYTLNLRKQMKCTLKCLALWSLRRCHWSDVLIKLIACHLQSSCVCQDLFAVAFFFANLWRGLLQLCYTGLDQAVNQLKHSYNKQHTHWPLCLSQHLVWVLDFAVWHLTQMYCTNEFLLIYLLITLQCIKQAIKHRVL